MLAAALAGFAAGLSLIVAIGAQNAFVLRQGILRQHLGVVVAICAVSDLVLIAAGTFGLGALVRSHPSVLHVLAWGGAAYLLWFAARTLWEARSAAGLEAAAGQSGRSVVLTALALTWLNPHVYLDTVLMLGTLSAGYGARQWAFSGGAMGASLIWFPALGLAGRRFAHVLARPRVWRVVGVVIALVMVVLAVGLVRAVGS